MFDFYSLFYNMGYLVKQDIYEACYWGVINEAQYKEITGEDYIA